MLNTLSGGQKQRIAIARALIKDPEIVMADELTGALDSNTGRQVLDTLKKLSETKLVIVVSHDREFAETYGDRIIELKDGKVIADITKEHSTPKNEGNITVIDDGTFVIKEGVTLNNKDLEVINNFLKDSQNEIVISNNESDVKKYKKEARISDDCSKEVFNSTDEKKIESKEYSKEEQKLIRSKLPIHHDIKIGLSSLRLKPFRLITTILLSCISFIMLGTVSTMMFYNKTNVAANALNTKKPKTVTIQKEYDVQYKYNNSNSKDYSSRLMLTMFDDSELNNYKAKYGKSIPYFTLDENPIIPGENVDARSYSILEIKNVVKDNYYYNHFNAFIDDLDNPMIKSRLEYGSLPSKSDEITISSYLADMIINSDNTIVESENSIKSRSDLIGKKINVTGCKYELSIVGIFNCDDLIDKKFEKLKKDYIEENAYSLRSEWANERLTGLFTKGVVNKDFYKINKKYNIEEKSVNLFTEDKSLNIFKFMKFKEGIDYYSLDGTLLDTLPDENI